MAEATAATFAVLEIELDIEIEVAVAVACDSPVALMDSDELILRTELVDPSLPTDPTADAAELAEETVAVVSPWAADVFVEATTLSFISPPAPAICVVKLMPVASAALVSSRDASFEFRENAMAGSPQIDDDKRALISQIVSLSAASSIHPPPPPPAVVTESIFRSLKLIGSANAGEAVAPSTQIKPTTIVGFITSISSRLR